MGKKLTQTEFIAKAVAAHGVGRYDYSQTVFCPGISPVTIGCPHHGFFEQSSYHHLKGHGCYKCAREKQGQQKRKTRAHYVALFKAKHGERYGYSLLPDEFMAKDVISIVCPAHGTFEQIADKHKLHGCARCTKAIGPVKLLSAETFRRLASKIHKHRYTYTSLTESIIRTQKVTVCCPEHGDFEQLSYYHLNGGACGACAWVKQGGSKLATLYFLRLYDAEEEFFKVGITYDSVKIRYKGRRSTGYYQYEVLATCISANASAIYDWEQSILETFAHLRYRPKRSFGGETECFSSSDEILAIFPL